MDRAPLYVRCYDLTLYLMKRTARFPKNQRFVLAQRVESAAFDLLESVALALQERAGRTERLRSADEALTRLRLAVRLCRELELLRENQLQFIQSELAEVGRMIGGWRRKLRHAGTEPQT